MKVFVKNASSAVEVDAQPSDFVAALKERYIHSDGFVGNPSFVSLVYRGRHLDDLHCLRDYGIHQGDILSHVSSIEAAHLLRSHKHGFAPRPHSHTTRGVHHGGGHRARHIPVGRAQKEEQEEQGDGGAPIPPPRMDYASLSRTLADLAASHADMQSEEWGQPGPPQRVTVNAGHDSPQPENDTLIPVLVGDSCFGVGGEAGGDTSEQSLDGGGASIILMPAWEVRELLGEAAVGSRRKSARTPTAPPSTPVCAPPPTTTSPRARPSHAGEGTPGVPTSESVEGMERGMHRAKELPSLYHEHGIAPGAKSEQARLRTARRAREALIPLYATNGAMQNVMPWTGYGGRPRGSSLHSPGRVHALVSEVRVGRANHTFKGLFRMEGRWNGEADMLHAQGQGHSPSTGLARVVSSTLLWDECACCWAETSALTSPDGLSSTQALTLEPVGDGTCKVEIVGRTRERGAGNAPGQLYPFSASLGAGLSALPPSVLADLDIRLKEVGGQDVHHPGQSASIGPDGSLQPSPPGTSIFLLTAMSRSTSLPVLIETIVLSFGDMRRVRTGQRFGGDGALVAVYTAREARVLDTLTGAMEVRQGEGGGSRAPTKSSDQTPYGYPYPYPGRSAYDDALIREVQELAERDPRVAYMIRGHRARKAFQEREALFRQDDVIDLSGLPLEGPIVAAVQSAMADVACALSAAEGIE